MMPYMEVIIETLIPPANIDGEMLPTDSMYSNAENNPINWPRIPVIAASNPMLFTIDGDDCSLFNSDLTATKMTAANSIVRMLINSKPPI